MDGCKINFFPQRDAEKKPSDATGEDSVEASKSVVVPQSVIAWEMEVCDVRRASVALANLSDPSGRI